MIRGMTLRQCCWRGTEWEMVALHGSGVNLSSCNAIIVTFGVSRTSIREDIQIEMSLITVKHEHFVMTVMHKELQVIICGNSYWKGQMGGKWLEMKNEINQTKVTSRESAHSHVGLPVCASMVKCWSWWCQPADVTEFIMAMILA